MFLKFKFNLIVKILNSFQQLKIDSINNYSPNKIYNLEADNAGGLVDGVSIVGGSNVNVYNNIIGDLRTPSSSLSK